MTSLVRSRRLVTAALASVLALVVSACSGEVQRAGGGSADEKHVAIGLVPWDECTASSYLWKELLERQDYTVEVKVLEPATVYAGVAQDQYDLFMCGVPKTHEDYWDRYGDDFEPVAQWYDTLIQGLAVPDYVDGETVADLEGRAGEFDGEIIGIESGSGLMQDLKENGLSDYDLSGYKVVGGSTATMLAALDRAIKREDPIIVTLWDPHWAFGKYPVRLLEDPEKSFGDGDVYNAIASKQAGEKTELIDQISRFHMTPEQLQTLELDIREAGEGNEQDGVRAWIDENQAAVDGWTAK